MSKKQQILFLSHGGGPMPLLGDPSHAEMVECLETLASTMIKPDAILVISAHWEEGTPTITSGAHPSLIYDYYGFPESSYQIKYPCLGEPTLAEKVHQQLGQAGITSKLDNTRGFDHGLFIPLKIMYPQADIPCVQLSLVNHLDPQAHIRIGQALQDIDYKNLLVIGSGFSFHNLKAFFDPADDHSQKLNLSFESWLKDTCTNQTLSEDERYDRLRNWENAPGARFCHPREEHLLPLHVCYGLAGKASSQSFEVTILNKLSSMYYWHIGTRVAGHLICGNT